MADAVDIEAVNKLRVAMGMKPIPTPSSTSGPTFQDEPGDGEEAASTYETREAAAQGNWHKHQQEQEAKAKAEARKEAIKRAREKAQAAAKLEGKGLGEADNDVELDTKAWLLGQKKRQKKIEKQRKKLEELYAEQEKQAEYTAKDLAGVKVGHQINEFDEGSEQVLTLKDSIIGQDDEEDELENADLRARQKLEEKLKLKKKKPVYNPMDDDGASTLLAQYDEEIDGKKRHKFTLDGQGSTVEQAAAVTANKSGKSKGITINLDMLQDDTPISDYVDPSTLKIRKPKKSKTKKSTRKKTVDADDIFPLPGDDTPAESAENGAMEIDSEANGKKRSFDNLLDDDDDLQTRLAAQRKQALKKRKKQTPEELASLIRNEPETPAATESVETEEPGLVLDQTTEFLNNLRAPEEREKEEEERKSRQRSRPKSTPPDTALPSVEAGSPYVDSQGDVDMGDGYAPSPSEDDAQNLSARPTSAKAPEISTTGLEEEGNMEVGIGATLKMLRERGLVKKTGEGENGTQHYRDTQNFLHEKSKRQNEAEAHAREQRERDRQSGRMKQMSAFERDEWARQENARRDQQESKRLANLFEQGYKPNFELRYVDEHGRNMNQKEAFKELSHQFHGKGSGNMKTEKKMKKIAEEKKREAMSALDASQHTVGYTAMGDESRKRRKAGVRLQ